MWEDITLSIVSAVGEAVCINWIADIVKSQLF